MKCKLRWVNFRTVSDLRRAFWKAFEVTEISDNSYRRTMEMIIISLKPPQSTMDNIECIWKHLGVPAIGLKAPRCTCVKSRSTSDKSESIAKHSRAVWEK